MIIPGVRISSLEGLSGPVYERLFTGHVTLPQRHVELGLPPLVILAELRVAVAFRAIGAILLPQEPQRHVLATQLLVDPPHIRQGPRRLEDFGCFRKEQRLKLVLFQPLRKGPTKTGLPHTQQVVRHRRVRQTTTPGDLPVAQSSLVLEAQNL